MAQSRTSIRVHRCLDCLIVTWLIVIVGGCAYERTSFDTTVGPSILSFESNYEVITSGEGDSTEVRGSVRLEWYTSDADAVTLWANGAAVDLSGCSNGCLGHAVVDLYPSESTRYELRATVGDANCTVNGDGSPNRAASCAAHQLSVSTVSPAYASLTTPRQTVLSGEWAEAEYTVDQAETWQIGWLDLGADETVFHPCIPEGDFEDDDAFSCLLSEELVDGEQTVGPAGTVSIPNLTSTVTLAARASNGAEDGLGNIRHSDATITIYVVGNPILDRFAILDDTVAASDGVTVQWALIAAEKLRISSTPEGAIDPDSASSCQDYSATRSSGTCVLALSEDLTPGAVTVTGVAVNGSGDESDPGNREFTVGSAPTGSISAEPALRDGEANAVTLSWSAAGASEVTITDNGQPAEVLLNSTPCDGCAAGGTLDVEEIDGNGQWFLVAENDFGEVLAYTGSEFASAPVIGGLWIDSALVDDAVLVSSGRADFEWVTEFALGASLHIAELDYQDTACPEEIEAYAHDLRFSGAPSGSTAFANIGVPRCVIFTATGVANQRELQTFSIARTANIGSFSVTENAVAGDRVELSWTATHVTELSFSASHVDADELAECGVDEVGSSASSCMVTILAGTDRDVTFQMNAFGFGQEEATTREDTVAIGSPPEIDNFEAEHRGDNVRLHWLVQAATEVTIWQGDELVHTAVDLEDGLVDVAAIEDSTTWTLRASNAYGTTEAQATAFVDVEITTFRVLDDSDETDQDGMDGFTTVFPGDVDVTFSVAAETASWILESAPLQENASCADIAGGGYGEEDSGVLADSTAEARVEIDGVSTNLCLKLETWRSLEELSVMYVLVTDVPLIDRLETTPSCVVVGGEDYSVEIDMRVRGASSAALSAQFRDQSGGEIGLGNSVCTNQDGRMDGTPVDSLDDIDLTCRHTLFQGDHTCVGCSRLGAFLDYINTIADFPAVGTIIYTLTLTDSEGDETTANSDAFDSSVTVYKSSIGSDDGSACDGD